MIKKKKVIVVGSGNVVFCVGIVVLESGVEVLMVEKVNEKEVGGNSRYIVGVMCFVYNLNEEFIFLLLNFEDEKFFKIDFGIYLKERF